MGVYLEQDISKYFIKNEPKKAAFLRNDSQCLTIKIINFIWIYLMLNKHIDIRLFILMFMFFPANSNIAHFAFSNIHFIIDLF
jgi:hypothetical protein